MRTVHGRRSPRRRFARAMESLEPRRLLAAIASDQSLTGSIDTPSEVDEYTFSASAGDSIIALAGEIDSTALDPAIALIGPTGNTIITDFGADGCDIFASLTETGTYTLRISDNGANGTGSYRLTMAKLPGAQAANDGEGGPIASGQRKDGALPRGDLDVYTFSAAAGDNVVITLADRDEGDYEPQLFVYGPGGAQIVTDIGTVGTDVFVSAASSGTYYIVVRDWIQEANPGFPDGDIDAGNYALRMVKLPGTQDQDDGDGGLIRSGERKDGHIDLGDMDVYTFNAATGDNIILTLAERNGDNGYDPAIAVYGPDGALLTSDIGTLGTDVFVSAASTGLYYVLVSDDVAEANPGFFDADVEAGDYSLRMFKAPGSQLSDDADGGALASGQRIDGHIDLGDMDIFTFTASSGDNLLLSLVERGSDTDFDPQIFVYGPTGALVASDIGSLGTDALFTAASGGTYYVVVRDLVSEANPGFFDGGVSAGDYTLRMVRLPGTQLQDDGGGGPIASGQRKDGVIDLGDMDVFTFTASAGDNIILTLVERGTRDFAPQMFIYGPTGALITSDFGFIGSDALVSAAASGTYYVVVRDFVTEANPGFYDSGIDAGDYSLRMVKLPGAQELDDADGGPLASGEIRYGTIDLGDLDVYTISANAGDSIIINAGRLGIDTYQVQTRLYSPSGALLDSANGSSDFIVAANSVAASGTYYIVVNDTVSEANPGFSDGGIETGDYAITAIVTPATQTVDADSGPLTTGVARAGAITAGDLDVFTFTATKGTPFTLNLADTAANGFSPWLRLYSPMGALVFNQANANAVSTTVSSPVAGTYTAVVLDGVGEGNSNGSYSIGLDTPAGADDFAPTVLCAEYRFRIPEVRVIFSEDIGGSFDVDDVLLTNLSTTEVIDNSLLLIDYSADRDLFTMTFPALDGRVLPDGNYRLQIAAADVTDAAGNPLASDLSTDFFVLAADFNRDRRVDFNDLVILAQNYNSPGGGAFETGDANYDQLVNFSDLVALAQRYGKTLPAAAATPAAPQAASRTAPPQRTRPAAPPARYTGLFNRAAPVRLPAATRRP